MSTEVRSRGYPQLAILEDSASTSRVLNLSSALKHAQNPEEMRRHPFFRNRALNCSIIVKHRVRPHEQMMFAKPAQIVTKVMVPVDADDLRCGARSLMVGQKDFDVAARDIAGEALRRNAPDRKILDLLDKLPSLDPFLLRGQLQRNGFYPAQSYFTIGEADVERMFQFVRAEIAPLAHLSFGDNSDASAMRLAEKLLSSHADESLAPLQKTMRMSDGDYQDGMFCWRGFLYYKWMIADLSLRIRPLVSSIRTYKPAGVITEVAKVKLPVVRRRFEVSLANATKSIREKLAAYDSAFRALTQDDSPLVFRDFLLKSADLFAVVGAQCGTVQHIASYWDYRFQGQNRVSADCTELMDLLREFSASLESAGVHPSSTR